jgi:hypothetical protein
MWFTVVKLFYERALFSLAVVKSTRRFRPPSYIFALWKPRKSSEVVRLSDLGVVIKGEGREFIKQYYGKWMRKREFLIVMKCALYRSYKNTRTVERMMSALREFANKPVNPKPRSRRPESVVYELPVYYPIPAVAAKGKSIYIPPAEIYVYVFSRTIHISPRFVTNAQATVVVPMSEISGIELTEKGISTLMDLLDHENKLHKYLPPEILDKLKPVIAYAKLIC